MKQQTVMARHRPPDLGARMGPALEAHAPTTMGKAWIPCHEIVRAAVAVEAWRRHSGLHFCDDERGIILEAHQFRKLPRKRLVEQRRFMAGANPVDTPFPKVDFGEKQGHEAPARLYVATELAVDTGHDA